MTTTNTTPTTLAPKSGKSLSHHFRTVMADEGGQAGIEMAVMLSMLVGSILLTNEMFNTLVQEYADTIIHFMRHP